MRSICILESDVQDGGYNTTIRFRFDRRDSIPQRYDLSTSYGTAGLLHCDLNK